VGDLVKKRLRISSKSGIKTQKTGITADPKGIDADKQGITADNFIAFGGNSSLKWLKIGRKMAILADFDG
jgi:hypothetical protein